MPETEAIQTKNNTFREKQIAYKKSEPAFGITAAPAVIQKQTDPSTLSRNMTVDSCAQKAIMSDLNFIDIKGQN